MSLEKNAFDGKAEELSFMRDPDLYNPPASHSLGTLPYTGRAYRIGLPKKILCSKRFFGKRARKRFLGKATVWL